ncbi:hypothetical protein EDB19DRAFT_2028496 [Suillus lakei]|nr:hypothetical protein EDB19DRAFT_2028496 [Suillus lakei]
MGIVNAEHKDISSLQSVDGVKEEDLEVGFRRTRLSGKDIIHGNNIGNNGDQNIILWADHCAEKGAELVNSTGSIALSYVGGTMSVCQQLQIQYTLLILLCEPLGMEHISLGELIDDGNWKQAGTAKGQVQAAGSPVCWLDGTVAARYTENVYYEGCFWALLSICRLLPSNQLQHVLDTFANSR